MNKCFFGTVNQMFCGSLQQVTIVNWAVIKSNHSAQFRQQKLGGATKDFSDGSEIAFVSKV